MLVVRPPSPGKAGKELACSAFWEFPDDTTMKSGARKGCLDCFEQFERVYSGRPSVRIVLSHRIEERGNCVER